MSDSKPLVAWTTCHPWIQKVVGEVRPENFDAAFLDLADDAVIGVGRIGSRRAHVASAFGCEVLYVDPVKPPVELVERCGLKRVELDQLIAELPLAMCGEARNSTPKSDVDTNVLSG